MPFFVTPDAHRIELQISNLHNHDGNTSFLRQNFFTEYSILHYFTVVNWQTT